MYTIGKTCVNLTVVGNRRSDGTNITRTNEPTNTNEKLGISGRDAETETQK